MADSDGDEQTTVQSWVIEACQDLGVRVEHADSDFFAAGGNSLAAVKLIARVETEFGEDALPPDDLFATSTVREIADTIVRNRATV